MKKKSRRSRSSETAQQQQSGRMQTSMNLGEGKRPSGNRGKTQRRLPGSVGMSKIYQDDSGMDANYGVTHTDKATEGKSKSTTGRLSTAICRLCHGKFSPRSLRHAFNKWPQDSEDLFEESDAAAQSPLLFHTDFQRLVGVQLDRDPSLSEFVCKKCYTKFYKCHSILIRFLQRVNLPPLGKENSKNRKNAKSPESTLNIKSTASPSFSSDSKCLHSLISWAHQHGEACRSCPNLKEVLEGQCWGSVKVVWGCVDGHSYIMDTQCGGGGGGGVNPSYTLKVSGEAARGGNGKGVPSEDGDNDDQEQEAFGGNQRTPARSAAHLAQSSPPTVTPQTQSSTLIDWASNTEDFIGPAEAISPVPAQLEDRTADTDLSDRAVSEDEFEESGKGALSEDELFEPHSEKRTRRVNAPNKRRPNQKAPEEPKVKRKPGPKPGWKNKFKPKGEELPNIYKCPYQGCTAVYRAPDGLKKHIKEHHEEVRERPCPHPGCNKVFMIDRYLQRHVKLIHTEERNYICDQCGQTFKQRKHLSVHQMRHSGAKPLQCEICGFQCRQRASLKYHMTKHKAEADLEFACLICGKRFEKAHNLNVHMSMVHPLTQVEAYKDGSQQQPPQPQYSNLHTITLTGEVVQQEQDR